MRLFLFLSAALIFSNFAIADQSTDGPFAVVELFSSQGCSSCPAAELLVSKLTAWARQTHQPIYPLVFHVDYWNEYGWRDIFSKPQYTQRQTAYSSIFKDQGGVYTPEMIVNGSDAFVGSDQEHLQQDLNQELSLSSNLSLQLELIKQDSEVVIKYKVQGFTNGDVINFALVERGLSTNVTAGENSDRKLQQDNVVMEFQRRPITSPEDQVAISLDRVADLSQASVIAFVQNPKTMLIEDAKQLDLDNG